MKHITVVYVPRRNTLILSVACVLLASCSRTTHDAATPNNEHNAEARAALFPVIVNGKYGFINTSGKVMIEPQFDDFSSGFFEDPWAEGLAAVCMAVASPLQTSPLLVNGASSTIAEG